jgi:hypothetical protein
MSLVGGAIIVQGKQMRQSAEATASLLMDGSKSTRINRIPGSHRQAGIPEEEEDSKLRH